MAIELDNRCVAHKKDGSPCGAYAIQGCSVCRVHGGMAPAVRAAGKRRLAERKVLTHLADLEVTEIDDPIACFKRLVAEAETIRTELVNRLALSTATGADWASELAIVAKWFDRVTSMLQKWIGLGIFQEATRSAQSSEESRKETRGILIEQMALMKRRTEAAALLHERFAESGDVIDADVMDDLQDDLVATLPGSVPGRPAEAPERPTTTPTAPARIDYIDGVSNGRHSRLIEIGGWDGKS